MKCKMPIQVNSHKNQPSSLESVRRTLSTPTGLCLTTSNIVWVTLNIVWNSKKSLTASFLRELYKYSHSSNGFLSWPHEFSGAKAHSLHL
jgi:hypothetical protein